MYKVLLVLLREWCKYPTGYFSSCWNFYDTLRCDWVPPRCIENGSQGIVRFSPYLQIASEVSSSEASQAISDGAKEIDMVLNVGALRAGDYSLVFSDIRAVVLACGTTPLKVILETVFLTDEEIIAASFMAANAGATFVKTCTGFLGGGATARHVSLMRTAVAFMPGVQVKASAGIRNFEKCVEMLEAGADRIGT